MECIELNIAPCTLKYNNVVHICVGKMERNGYRDQKAVYFEAVFLASMFALVYIFIYIMLYNFI